MNCKHLKYRTKKGIKYIYCSKLKKQIMYSDCANCQYKEYKCTIKPKSLCKKSNKINKLERNRKSVFTNNLSVCIMCGKPKDNLHEIYMGKNRLNSMKYGFVIPVCIRCHHICHKDSHIQEFWHKEGQLYFEREIGSRTEFIDIFKRDYLSTKKD